jgi:hypothetical protein
MKQFPVFCLKTSKLLLFPSAALFSSWLLQEQSARKSWGVEEEKRHVRGGLEGFQSQAPKSSADHLDGLWISRRGGVVELATPAKRWRRVRRVMMDLDTLNGTGESHMSCCLDSTKKRINV